MTQPRPCDELPNDAVLVPREHVERIANVMGRTSSAARALADADGWDGEVKFWFSSAKSSLFVERVPK